jgi:signal transduction histidine kinase
MRRAKPVRQIDPASIRAERRVNQRIIAWFILGYPLLYVCGYLSKSIPGSAAIWPADALIFAGFMLLPVRLWPVILCAVVSWELFLRPLLYALTFHAHSSVAISLKFALANLLTTAGPAALAGVLGLYRRQERFALVISPLWIVALFAGAFPGALIGAMTNAQAAGVAAGPADIGRWLLSSVLSTVTFGPLVFGLLLGFSEPTPVPARAWEAWAVCCMVAAFFGCFALVPWPGADPLVQPMLFAAPLAWLALRFSRRTTNIGVVAVASGVVVFAGYGMGIYSDFTSLGGWRNVVISIEVFLVIACGGALLINLMTLKQRALLDELAREHLALRDYAHALGVAEETARRKTAADLHDGIGQILAGQSMTLAAMRMHAVHPPLAAMLGEVLEASREAQEGLRVMIQDLSPPELDQASLEEMLRWLAEFFMARFGFSVTWRITGNAEVRRDRLRLIYRCIRELLMNARKHSQRQCADVEVKVTAAGIEITVSDAGVGFDARRAQRPTERRFGLAQLRERLRAVGGTLVLDAAVGEGCRATVRLPSPALH